LGDAVGPVAEILEWHAAELYGEPVHHELAGLAGGDTASPRFRPRLELTELGRNGPRRLLTELMAADAVSVVHPVAPDFLCDVLRNVSGAAEILRRRDLHHRVPVDRRIIVCRRPRVRHRHRGEVELL